MSSHPRDRWGFPVYQLDQNKSRQHKSHKGLTREFDNSTIVTRKCIKRSCKVKGSPVNISEHAEILGALELGIVPPSGCVDQLLATLPAGDAHLARRKYRKIKRKLIKRLWNSPGVAQATPAFTRQLVRAYCRQIGEKILKV